MQRLAHLKNVLSAAGRAMSTSPSPASIERIFVWDFDNTLFSSPLPQRDLLDPSMLRILTGSHVTAVGWWTDPRSLHGPKDEGWSDDGWIWDEGRWCAEKWVQGPELAKGAWRCARLLV